MIVVADISASIALAEAYYVQLLDEDTAALKKGCSAPNSKAISCLNRLIRALKSDVAINYIDSVTIGLYDLLLKAISTYSGASLPYDPNVVIPGTTVIIQNPAGTTPPVLITFADMSLNGTRYDNPLWAGLNPFLEVDNTTWLRVNVDYSLIPSGGFILSPTGSVPQIYDGQLIRSLNYALV